MTVRSLAALLFAASVSGSVAADEIGSVDTAFKLLGANHKIVVEAFDDPKVDGAQG